MKILNFGSCNIDYVYSVDHIVNVGETENSSRLEIFPGGKGLNQSIALARAGAKVYHAGMIGSDGEFLANLLRQSDVDTSYIKRTEEKNGHAIIQLSKDGENSIFLYPGSNATIKKSYVDGVLANFEKGDIILLQNEINNIEYIISRASQIGMQIILNPSPYNEQIAKINFPDVSYLILNFIEAQTISGKKRLVDILSYFKSKLPTVKLMLTLGKNGCIYQFNNQIISHPIFKSTVVDTTAAGDTFTGYFVAGLERNLDISQIIKLASLASAIAVSRKGAAQSIPTIKEVMNSLKKFNTSDFDK